jgi:hypothetical protein
VWEWRLQFAHYDADRNHFWRSQNFFGDPRCDPLEEDVAFVFDHQFGSKRRFGVVECGREIVRCARLADVGLNIEIDFERLRACSFFIERTNDAHNAESTNFYGVKHSATVAAADAVRERPLPTGFVLPRR